MILNFFYFQDMFILETPGGGGYGTPSDSPIRFENKHLRRIFLERGSVLEYTKSQESA